MVAVVARLGFGLAAASMALIPVSADLDECLAALSTLNKPPYNASLPIMNGVTGRMNVAYLFQRQAFAILPNELMGSYDLCKNAHIYSTGPMDTHYCTLSRDRAGVCVPKACTAEDLMNPAAAMPILNLGMQSIAQLPMDCVVDPYLTPRCAFMKQGWEYFQSLYNHLMLFGKKSPQNPQGGITCDPEPAKPDGGSVLIMIITTVLALLVAGSASWQYMVSCAKEEAAMPKEEPKKAAQAVEMTATKKEQPTASTVPKTPGGTPEFQEISLEESKSNAKDAETETAEPEKKADKKADKKSPKKAAPAPAPAKKEPVIPPSPPAYIAAFSAIDTYKEIFNLQGRVGEFACFDAMRAISAAWVVFYHVLLWQISYVQNPEYLVPPKGLLGQWWATPFFNYSGTLSVDTFFFISGFLASYLLLMKLDKEDAKGESKPAWKWVPWAYLMRYIRVSPAYFFSFLLHWKIAPLLASGPMSQQIWKYNNAPCDDSWWTHFLYINNIIPWWNQRYGKICFGHSWYLANDWQYFLSVPVFVILYRSGGKKGKLAASIAVICAFMINIISSLALAVEDKWSPIAWDGVEGDHYREQAFPRPWIRGASYMMGIFMSFVWYEKKTRFPDYKFTARQANMIWLSSMFLLAISMYGPFSASNGIIPCGLPISNPKTCGSGWSRSDKASVIAFLRPVWTAGVALMCVLCWNNQGGLIQDFLTAKIWVPLSAMSYTIYLTHYTVLTFWVSQRVLRFRFGLFDFLNVFFGLSAITCALALVVMFLVERPFQKLQKHYIEGGNKRVAKKTVS